VYTACTGVEYTYLGYQGGHIEGIHHPPWYQVGHIPGLNLPLCPETGRITGFKPPFMPETGRITGNIPPFMPGNRENNRENSLLYARKQGE